jgi:hypothetical protein
VSYRGAIVDIAFDDPPVPLVEDSPAIQGSESAQVTGTSIEHRAVDESSGVVLHLTHPCLHPRN